MKGFSFRKRLGFMLILCLRVMKGCSLIVVRDLLTNDLDFKEVMGFMIEYSTIPKELLAPLSKHTTNTLIHSLHQIKTTLSLHFPMPQQQQHFQSTV